MSRRSNTEVQPPVDEEAAKCRAALYHTHHCAECHGKPVGKLCPVGLKLFSDAFEFHFIRIGSSHD